LTQIQCFSQIARSVGNKIPKENIKDIFPILNEQAHAIASKGQSTDLENEIAEASLSAIENLIRKAPKEIDEYIDNIFDLGSHLMVFDPNYTYEDGKAGDDEGWGEEAGWGSDFEDEQMANEDDDDTSWKVRRAAIKLIEALVSSRPDKLRTVYQKYASLMIQRFKERDDNVKCNILETYRVFLKCAVHTETVDTDYMSMGDVSLQRVMSAADELAKLVEMTIEELVKQLRKSKNAKVKTAVMHTFA
jgi:cullin-associated NEDD8-dissociated protein 1